VEAFHRTDRVTLSAASFAAAVDNSYLVVLDCDCMDGRYSASYTSAGSGVADNDDVMIELVAKAVRE
jgi:hypothetical protein